MSKYIEQAHWVNFDSAVNRFADFIKRAGPIGDYHVVFSMGTTVRIDPHADLIEFVEYTGEYVENYPVAQISEDIDDIIANNIIAWEIQKNIPSYGRIIRSAYHFLISTGYIPVTVDKIPIPCQNPSTHGDILWNVLWPKMPFNITNLVISANDDPVIAAVIGAELRRCDYMFPIVRAVITPNSEIVYI